MFPVSFFLRNLLQLFYTESASEPLYLGDDSAAVQEDLARSRGAADSLTAEEQLYLEDPADLGLGDDGLGAADAGSVNTDYDSLQAQSDKFHPSGPSPVRHTDVPTTNFEGRNIPKSTSTIYGAQGTPDAAVMQLEQMIADGKWRFEIDDSGMKYYKGGDAYFSQAHPEYAEHQSLMNKLLSVEGLSSEE